MQIIHLVLGKANPERMNGVNKVAFQLAKNQYELGYPASVWGIANDLSHNYPPRAFETRLFQQGRNKLRLDPALRQAIEALPLQSVVHLHGSFIPEFFLVARRLRQRGIPYVYTPHGSLTEAALQQSKWQKQAYFQFFEKYVVRHAAAVHLLGEQEFAYLDRLMQHPHKVLIPNGMDLGELPALPEKTARETPVFGFCGRLDAYHKGLDLLLEGFAQFLNNGHHARLELIGDGADRAALENQARKLGISGQVVFHGARYGAEKYRMMAAADLFLHTSRMEGFPMAVLEAAALGLPCLTSIPTSMNPYMRQYQAGIPLSDLSAAGISAAFAQATQCHRDGTLAEMGHRAKDMIAAAFDWKHICRQLVAVYAQVLEAPTTGLSTAAGVQVSA